MVRLLITRHGETEYNIKGMFQGWQDSPLTENGIINAKALGARLKDDSIDAVYVSPAPRTQKTAKIVLGGRNVPIHVLEDLKELGFGKLEGTRFDKLEQSVGMKKAEFFDNLYTVAENAEKLYGGENICDFERRVLNALSRIIEENDGRTVLIVTHANPTLVMMRHFVKLTGGAAESVPRLFQTSLSEVIVSGDDVKVLKVGDTSHFVKNMKSH